MTALPLVLMTEEEVAGYGRNDGGFGALETERGRLPLTAMDVDAKVVGVIANVEVAQTFVNTTGGAIEATYIFPLPDRAAVHRFRMEVAGRVIEGVVDERGAAREQYEQAIQQGHRAAITEEERPGTFTLRVGNLLPGEAATVRLSLVGPLPIDDGEVTFRFPLVVAPRYIPGVALGGEQAGLGREVDTDLVPDASRISPPVLLPGFANPVRLGMRVALEDGRVRDVASSLHAVTSSLRDAQVIEARPGERLDRDFILRWHVDQPSAPPVGGAARSGGAEPFAAELRSTLVCADDTDGAAGSFMLTLVPPSTTAVGAKPRDVVFVIDRSGSMGGWKMVAARRAAARMIDSLTSRDRFCALAFDDSVDFIPGAQLMEASDRNRFRAVEALAKIDARGGTEMFDPLRRAATLLAGGHDDRERVIVLVTDGQVGNEDHILRELAPNLKNVRMFTLGIDQAVNAGFLRRLAGAGGGLCELVESEDRLDAVMAKVHRRIGTPIATELSITASGLELDRNATPKKLPDVYAGAPVVILGRYRGKAPANAAIDVQGTSLGDPLRLSVQREPASANAWLAASWARAHIRELEDRYAAGEHGVESEIVAVSKRFSVLSRFTAFLAVDRSEVANKGGQLTQIVQPVEKPAGWDMPVAGGRAMRTMAGIAPTRPAFAAPMPAPMGPPGAPMAASGGPVMNAMGGGPKAEASDQLIAPHAARMRGNPGPSHMRAQAMPPAPPASYSAPTRNEAEPVSPATYLAQLGVLARELESQAKGRADAMAIRLLRQRLAEWVEDIRSTGAHTELSIAVDALVKRLATALAGTNLASDALAIATELARLAANPATKQGRTFWK